MQSLPRKLTGSLLGALLLLASCASSPAGPAIPTLVASSATAALVIADPQVFLKGLSAAWDYSRLAATTGLDPKTSLEEELPFAALAEKIVDGRRPWVLELLPSLAPEGSPRLLLELPYVGDPTELSRALEKQGFHEKGRASGYLAFSDAEGPLDFPQAEAADLSLLERWPKGSLALWVNPTRLAEGGKLFEEARKLLGGEEERLAEADRPFQEAFRKGAESRRPDALASEEAKADAELSALFEAFKPTISDFSSALVPGRSALALRFAFRLAPGSRGSGLLAEAARAPSALPWTTKLPSEALLSASWTSDPGFARDLDARLRPFLETFLKAAGLAPEGRAKELLDSALASSHLEDELAALGDRGALWLDLDPEAAMAAAAGLGKGDASGASDLVPRLVSLRESRDPSAAAALMAKTFDPSFLDPLAEALSASSGAKIGFRPQSSGSGAEASGSLAFSLDNPSWSEGDKATIDGLLSAATLRWAVGPSLLAVGTGDAAEIRRIAEGERPSSPLSRDPDFAALARSLPQGSQYLFTFSTARLAALVKAAQSASGKEGTDETGLSRLDPERFGRLSFWLLAEGPSKDARGGELGPLAETGLALGTADIGALVELFAARKGGEAEE